MRREHLEKKMKTITVLSFLVLLFATVEGGLGVSEPRLINVDLSKICDRKDQQTPKQTDLA